MNNFVQIFYFINALRSVSLSVLSVSLCLPVCLSVCLYGVLCIRPQDPESKPHDPDFGILTMLEFLMIGFGLVSML
jgi:hypothetical protein